jgi:hypothetical protein
MLNAVYFAHATPSSVRRQAKIPASSRDVPELQSSWVKLNCAVPCSATGGMNDRFIRTVLAKTRTGVEVKNVASGRE